jgi:Spy/CpxP family protein refolding chaperone
MLKSLRSKIALAALAAGFAAVPSLARAQSATTTDSAAVAQPKHRHHHPLFRGITLSDSQRTQLRAIRAKYGPQFRDARQAKDRATIKQLRGQMVDEARGVLTPEQQQQFDTNRANVKKHFKKSQSGATPATPATPAPAAAPTPTPNS